MSLEGTGGGEFAKAVTDHVVRDKHSGEAFAVVHFEGDPNHVREDHGAAGPSFDGLAGGGLVDFRLKVQVDKGAFLDGAGHGLFPPGNDVVLRDLAGIAGLLAFGKLAPRRAGDYRDASYLLRAF
jgi:hypothetical protein